jgi:hypothetical protein
MMLLGPMVNEKTSPYFLAQASNLFVDQLEFDEM